MFDLSLSVSQKEKYCRGSAGYELCTKAKSGMARHPGICNDQATPAALCHFRRGCIPINPFAMESPRPVHSGASFTLQRIPESRRCVHLVSAQRYPKPSCVSQSMFESGQVRSWIIDLISFDTASNMKVISFVCDVCANLTDSSEMSAYEFDVVCFSLVRQTAVEYNSSPS